MESSTAEELEPIKRVIELGADAVVTMTDGAAALPRAPVTAKIRAMTIATIGLLATPLGGLMAGDEILWHKLQSLIAAERPPVTQSAVLAVDTKGLSVRANNASASTKELFEQAAMEHLARLHHRFNSWSERNQELMGSVSLKLSVDASGNVVCVESVNSHVNDSGFVQTVIDDVREWKFSGAEGAAAEIVVPLLFIPNGMDAAMIVQWERQIRGVPRADNAPQSLPAATMLAAIQPNEKTVAPPPNAVSPAVAAPTAKVAAKPLAMVIATRPIAIRDNPRYSAASVRKVEEATQLSVLENRGDWLKVRAGGQVGFVRKEYVSPVNG